MTQTFRNIAAGSLAVMLALGATLTSCSDESTYLFDSDLHSFGPSPATRGETIRIIGTNLSGVSSVVFPVDVAVNEFVSRTDTELVVTVPQEAVPGKIILISGGKQIESKSIITFSEPISIDEITTPRPTLVAGDVITISGEYLYNVATVTFGNNAEVAAEDFESQSRHELKVKVPAEAKSGKISFSDGADWTFTSEAEYEIASAEATSLSATALDEGQSVSVIGTNLQLVMAVYFPGDIQAEFTVNSDGTRLDTRVPVGTCSGVITLELFSLDRIETPAFTVPEIAYASISPDSDIVPGSAVTITGSRLNLVSRIIFPGEESVSSGWTVSSDGTTLTVDTPNSIVDGRITLVQNDNISIQTDAVTVRKAGNVFWTGSFDLGGWAQNLEVSKDHPDIYPAFDAAITGPGKLTINFEEDSSQGWWQIQPRYRRDWSTCFTNVRDDNGGIHNMEPGQTSWTFVLTQEDVDELRADGWAFSGCYLTIKSMEFEAN
ncbi:MAG: hypothetical protein K2I48_07510 [Muribaculaceae bacterium]|nr:hypothetical protein [Muribaculaceae bacterium]